MRLTAEQVRCIRDPILEEDPGAEILLFGSRADDNARGGDIDILCFSQTIDRRSKRRIRREISDRVGGQKVDLVVAKDASTPFVRLVMEEAVPLTPRIRARNEPSVASPSS
jgi:predicted nucleotidyltransferase